MSTYKREMDKIRLSEDAKKRVLDLYGTSGRKENTSMKIRSFVKPAVAVAVCAAVFGGFVVSGNLSVNEEPRDVAAGTEGAAEIAGSSDHDFTIRVNAAELTEDTPVVVKNDSNEAENEVGVSADQPQGWAICGSEGSNSASYSIGTEFSCEGDGIKSITYSVNQGSFQIISVDGLSSSPVTEKTEVDTPINAPMTAGEVSYYKELRFVTDDEVAPAVSVVGGEDYANQDYSYSGEQVTSYTVDYDRQQGENVWFNLIGEKEVEHYDALFGDAVSLEEEKAAMDELVGGVVVTCTVEFEDGTTTSREIALVNEIMTEQEANPEILDSPNPEDHEPDVLNYKSVWITFQIKK